jgi:cellobiose epimerase
VRLRRHAASLIKAGLDRLPYRSPVSPALNTTPGDVLSTKPMLERLLTENITPFWVTNTIDRELGGFCLNHDVAGRWRKAANKTLVTQARMLWYFSRLYKSDYGKISHLAAARHGFSFLHDCMWDREYGGFFWEVDSTGQRVVKENKHMYGQAFALYGLSEYVQASQDSSAAKICDDLFELMEAKAHDAEFGGVREFFHRDWRVPVERESGYLSEVMPGEKRMNTHLHLLEALTGYYTVNSGRVVRDRLNELVFVCSSALVRKTSGACTEHYQPDWTPLLDNGRDVVSYGHDLEIIWLLIKACQVLRFPNGPFVDLYVQLFDTSLRFGYDTAKGGFYTSGTLDSLAKDRRKMWWVQAEALVATLYMHRVTGADRFADCYLKTLDWIVSYQTDWENGDWHREVAINGRPRGSKADGWKAAYHNGRAMIECLEILQSRRDVL